MLCRLTGPGWLAETHNTEHKRQVRPRTKQGQANLEDSHGIVFFFHHSRLGTCGSSQSYGRWRGHSVSPRSCFAESRTSPTDLARKARHKSMFQRRPGHDKSRLEHLCIGCIGYWSGKTGILSKTLLRQKVPVSGENSKIWPEELRYTSFFVSAEAHKASQTLGIAHLRAN